METIKCPKCTGGAVMETIEVEKSTKKRLIRLAGASSLDETIRSLMEQAKELAEYKAESRYIFDSLPRA